MDLEPLKVKGQCFFATLRTTYPVMQHHIPEDLKRWSGHYENFKTHNTVAYETTQSLGNYMNFSAVFLLIHEWQNIYTIEGDT